jgi:CO/xanthine dehydrogenase FAD-binding subunit
MEILRPDTLADALQMKAAHPGARPIAGGTDLMVELNFDRARPEEIIDLDRVAELREHGRENGALRIGAGVSYTRLIGELSDRLPGLAIASRTVGSPQIRNRGTVGGNLGTSSPAGDGLPPLFACDAVVEVASADGGARRVPVAEFVTGPKRNALRDDELIVAFHIAPAGGPQQFAKIGTRNAMVIAVCSLSVHLWPQERAVKACIGSAGPTPIRATEAEAFVASVIDEDGLWESRDPLGAAAVSEFGVLVERAARPIDDVRGTAAYRHHALGVLARRTLQWTWNEYRGEA